MTVVTRTISLPLELLMWLEVESQERGLSVSKLSVELMREARAARGEVRGMATARTSGEEDQVAEEA